jgi:hypothetical protein
MKDKKIRNIIGHMLSGNDDTASAILTEMVSKKISEMDLNQKIESLLESNKGHGDYNE